MRLRPAGDAPAPVDGYLASVTGARMIPRRQRFVLGAVAILVCELITVGGTIAAAQHQDDRVAINALAIALLAIPPLVLPLRLKWPLEVLAFTLACTLAYSWIGFPGGPIYLA